MTDDMIPPANFLYDSLVLQSYGHSQWGEAEMPENPEINESLEDDPEYQALLKQAQENGFKIHPIADSVYFSGLADPKALQLPHTSKEALKNYLEYQLKLRKQLNYEFNPKPGIY